MRMNHILHDQAIIVAANVGTDYEVADLSQVTIVGTSNGCAIIYRFLVEFSNPQPFQQVICMVSSVINKQYHSSSFWKPSCDDCSQESDYDTPATPPQPGPKFIHLHGTEDGTVPYLGGGGNFLGPDVDFLP